MIRRLFSVKASLFVIVIAAFAMAALACGSQPAAAPAPAPAPAQPAIDPAELSKLVQDAVKQSVPEQQSGPAPVSAQEIQSMVEAAVSAGAPEGASAEEISAMVRQAVTAAAQPAAQPGASKADIEDIVAKAVADAATSGTSTLSANEVQMIVSEAIKGIPTASPVQVVITPTPAPQAGTLRVVVTNAGTPLFLNNRAKWPLNNYHNAWLITENLAMKKGPDDLPMLAESWEMASDKSMVTFKLREGVNFRSADRDWGEMTADDVAWSYNDAGADNVESVHDAADTIGLTWEPWVAVSKYVVEAPFDQFAGNWLTATISNWNEPVSIYSKAVFDELGQEALTTPVGTGPMKALEWRSNELVVAEAVPDHWRITPNYKRLTVIEAGEPLVRVAIMRTGEAEIGEVPLREIPDLVNRGFATDDGVKIVTGQSVWFAGNYWAKTVPATGESVVREGFTPDAAHPWIGDPDDDARMESARKVRMALSMAIDRNAINQTILGGQGDIGYSGWFTINHPEFKDKWTVDYDPEGAKMLLAEAGYPDGFEFTFFIPPDLSSVDPEVGEAIVSFWTDLGLKVNIEKTAYSARRPTMVARQINDVWLMQAPEPPVGGGTWGFCFPQPGWNAGFESDYCYETWKKTTPQEQGSDENLASREEFADYIHDWHIVTSTVSIPKLYVFDATKIESWELERHSQAIINGLDTVRLRR